MQTIGFGGGCHWCTEAVFQALSGVECVEQGWIKSTAPFESFSEAVRIMFDPDRIPLQVLIEVHLRTHASQSNHSFRSKYRSAVYVLGDVQAEAARASIDALQADFDKALVTQVVPLVAFKASEPHFQNYYLDNPDRPFCRTYIDPKLTLIRQQFRPFVSD